MCSLAAGVKNSGHAFRSRPRRHRPRRRHHPLRRRRSRRPRRHQRRRHRRPRPQLPPPTLPSPTPPPPAPPPPTPPPPTPPPPAPPPPGRIAAPRAAAARAVADCVAADHATAGRAAAIPQPPLLPAPYPSYNQTTRSGPSGHSPGVAREWGSNPHPTTPPPPSTRAHPACRPGLETVGRGEGGRHSSPGAGQRERGPPNSSLGRYTPPRI